MQRRGLVLASVALLLAAAGMTRWWCSGGATPSTQLARADEDGSEGRRAVALESALDATTDAPLDASREQADDPYDPKHYVVIPTRELCLEVVDALDRTPIEGVTFKLNKYEVAGLPPLGEARTGSDGKATFTLPTDRRLHFTMEAKGFAPEQLLVPEEPYGTREQPFVIELQRTASIHGRLFGSSGEPVTGARVWLNSATWSGSGELTSTHWSGGSRMTGYVTIVTPPRTERPDSSGEPTNEFLFEKVPSDTVFELSATAGDDDRQLGSMSLCLEPGERREIEWRVGSPSSLAGRVVDDAGAPVAGATVREPTTLSLADTDGNEPRTDANGEFAIDHLSAGRHVLAVRSSDPRCASASYSFTLAAGESRRGVEIVLPRAAPLIVRAHFLDGNVPKALTAIVSSPRARVTEGAEVANDGEAAVTIASVPLGEVEVDVVGRAEGCGVTGHARFVHDGEHECVVECAAMATIRGSVELASGRPVNARVQLALIRRDGAEEFGRPRPGTETESDAFDFAAVRPGEYDLIASTTDGDVGIVPSVVLASGERRDHVVVRVAPGAALRVVAIELAERPARSAWGDRGFEVRVRRDGACVAASPLAGLRNCELPVPPGKLTVEVWSGGELLASRDVEARAYAVARVRF